MYETDYDLFNIGFLKIPNLEIDIFEMNGRFDDLEHDRDYLAKVLRNNELIEFTNLDFEHLYNNLCDCGIPFFVIETLLANINRSLVIPFNKDNYNEFIDLFCEEDQVGDEYHELVWSYTHYRHLYNLEDYRTHFKKGFDPEKLIITKKWEIKK